MPLLDKVYDGFLSLQGSPNELWKAYTLKFLDSYSYFSFSVIFTLFLSEDFGYTDVQAGTLYGIWGAAITVLGLTTGWVIDNLGVASSLRWGFALSLISRIWILLATSRTALLFNICLLLPMANCLGIPVLTVAIRRYTTTHNRGFAFGLFYSIMNVAALLSGPMVDVCTVWYKREADTAKWSLTGYRLVVLTTVVANVLAVLVSWTVREIKVETRKHRNSDADQEEGGERREDVSTFEVSAGSPWQIVSETVRTRVFWRYLAVCLIMLNVRMIFRHLDATFPKYMVREFGDKVAKGTIYSINPFMIILLVPLVQAATTGIDPLLMMHHGSYISTASVFFLVFSTTIPASILFVIVLSLGEAVWSPRLYDYTMMVTPEGREGTYMALSSAPLFLAKLPVGTMSGILLQKYCPEEGERHSSTMWLIIGLTTAVSPILMTLCWKYISKTDDDGGGTELRELAPSEQPLESSETQSPSYNSLS